MTQPVNNISVNGNSVVISNATITFSNALDPTTGYATITITPLGGLGTLPALLAGQSGPPPVFQLGTITTLAAGNSATATLTQLSPGGPGTASVYQLALGIPIGATGSSGSFTIGGATDLSGSATNGFCPVWNTGTSKYKLQTVPFAPTYYASSVSSTSGTGAGPRTLATISVPAQTYSWLPIPAATCAVAGTVNTQVNLQVFETSTSGSQVGIAQGVTGTANQSLSLVAGVPTGSASTYGVIAPGTSATILLAATQVAATSDAWATTAATTTFQVTALPVST